MAKVATPSVMPPSSHRIRNGVSIGKRKTPSELRGEQLKRESVVDLTDECSQSSAVVLQMPLRWIIGLTNRDYLGRRDTMIHNLMKYLLPKSQRFKIPSGKENVKGKALRGLASIGPRGDNGLATDSSEGRGDSAPTIAVNSSSECHIPGKKAPLGSYFKNQYANSIPCFCELEWKYEKFPGLQSFAFMDVSPICSSAFYHIMLSSSTAEGELEFLRKRQVAWEESFHDLYYMLWKNICGLFYVCTSQFIVMFTGGDGSGKSKCSCNAYISQSTRGFRSLLREHDLCFSMPLCCSKEEQVTTEDLVELSEIEKQNLGQTRRSRSFSDADNSPESLLVFSGSNNVHGLFDLFLNYRTLVTSPSSVDGCACLVFSCSVSKFCFDFS